MQYEVEIKSLLGSEESAQQLKSRLASIDSHFKLLSSNKQLNHYFIGGNIEELATLSQEHLAADALNKLKIIGSSAKDFSIRTREKDTAVLLVVKASLGSDSSQNGVSRMEFEEKMPFSLSDLDDLLRTAGFEYQAKWSREREEYACRGVSVCLDRNAGYGWLAEFERVVDSQEKVDEARAEVRALMDACGVQELQQDRLERMFAFYNAHWPEYYGTDKVFTIA